MINNEPSIKKHSARPSSFSCHACHTILSSWHPGGRGGKGGGVGAKLTGLEPFGDAPSGGAGIPAMGAAEAAGIGCAGGIGGNGAAQRRRSFGSSSSPNHLWWLLHHYIWIARGQSILAGGASGRFGIAFTGTGFAWERKPGGRKVCWSGLTAAASTRRRSGGPAAGHISAVHGPKQLRSGGPRQFTILYIHQCQASCHKKTKRTK